MDLIFSIIGVTRGVFGSLCKGQGPVHLLISEYGGFGIPLQQMSMVEEDELLWISFGFHTRICAAIWLRGHYLEATIERAVKSWSGKARSPIQY